MSNNSKIILDLCGGSGAWSRPYKEAGYDVRVLTLPEYDVTDSDVDEEVLYFSRFMRGEQIVPIHMIYGVLAAPPCTEFSVAKGNRPRNLEGAMEIVEACMRIIWRVREHTKLAFWALENPRGLLRQFLGLPAYTFEQWQFGGDKRKATDIWGYFNIPKASVKEFPLADYTIRNPSGSVNSRAWGKCEYPPMYADYINSLNGYAAKRAAARAITPAGFADAFYRSNK